MTNLMLNTFEGTKFWLIDDVVRFFEDPDFRKAAVIEINPGVVEKDVLGCIIRALREQQAAAASGRKSSIDRYATIRDQFTEETIEIIGELGQSHDDPNIRRITLQFLNQYRQDSGIRNQGPFSVVECIDHLEM